MTKRGYDAIVDRGFEALGCQERMSFSQTDRSKDRREIPYVAYWAVIRRRIETLKKTWGLSVENARDQAHFELEESGIFCPDWRAINVRKGYVCGDIEHHFLRSAV